MFAHIRNLVNWILQKIRPVEEIKPPLPYRGMLDLEEDYFDEYVTIR